MKLKRKFGKKLKPKFVISLNFSDVKSQELFFEVKKSKDKGRGLIDSSKISVFNKNFSINLA